MGFALFSMFFGAGNVVFSPYLGMGSGPQWLLGFLCYYIADVGLAMVALFALLKCGGSTNMMEKIGPMATALLLSAIVVCIGPLLAIPRTGATTYELAVAPLTGAISPFVFSVLYFALVLVLCLKEASVVDIVGKFLTPALVGGLLVLIVVGMIKPIGPIAETAALENVPKEGIVSGYQTMDVLATLIFGYIVLKSASDKGYEGRQQTFAVAGAGMVAGLGLMVVYMGLSYLGATVSSVYSPGIDRSQLVLAIVEQLMGHSGLLLFAVIVGLACLTTAVGLTSAAATFFESLFKGRIKYQTLVILICVCSAAFANFGLDTIVSIASPILNVVYPPTLTVIVLSFFKDRLPETGVHKMAAFGALLFSLLETLAGYGLPFGFVKVLPFAGLGFGWLVPALAFGLLGLVFCRVFKKAPAQKGGCGKTAEN